MLLAGSTLAVNGPHQGYYVLLHCGTEACPIGAHPDSPIPSNGRDMEIPPRDRSKEVLGSPMQFG